MIRCTQKLQQYIAQLSKFIKKVFREMMVLTYATGAAKIKQGKILPPRHTGKMARDKYISVCDWIKIEHFGACPIHYLMQT